MMKLSERMKVGILDEGLEGYGLEELMAWVTEVAKLEAEIEGLEKALSWHELKNIQIAQLESENEALRETRTASATSRLPNTGPIFQQR
jgi:hypothetical protein